MVSPRLFRGGQRLLLGIALVTANIFFADPRWLKNTQMAELILGDIEHGRSQIAAENPVC